MIYKRSYFRDIYKMIIYIAKGAWGDSARQQSGKSVETCTRESKTETKTLKTDKDGKLQDTQTSKPTLTHRQTKGR